MLHHVEIYVSDLERSIAFWTPLMTQLGYEPDRWSGGMNYVKPDEAYLCFLPAPAEHLAAGYHRKRVGLNHLAFRARSRAQVDELAAWVKASGHTLLYESRHPYAGGPGYYAMYCEDPDRIKVEVAAPGLRPAMPADRFDHLFIEPSNFDAAVAFYRDGLGWTELFGWGEPGQPRGVGLSGGGVRLVLAEDHATQDHARSHGVAGTRPTVHLVVDDLDARHAALAARGLALFPPETTHWGARWFVVRDPDGNLIAFEQARTA